jgi:VanZ family protein
VRLSTGAKYWIASAVWATVISILSTDSFSSEHTAGLVITVLRWIFPHTSMETLELMHAVIRKTAHLTEYFILGALLFLAQRGENKGWKLRWAILAIVMCAGYASLDEFHQSFVPSRTASPWDALIDTTGASVAQCLLWIWHKGRKAVVSDQSENLTNVF